VDKFEDLEPSIAGRCVAAWETAVQTVDRNTNDKQLYYINIAF